MRWWQRIPYTWRLAFGLWLGMRVILWGISAFLFFSGVIPLDSPFPEAPVALDEGLAGALFGSWLRWDGGFYYLILTDGYAQNISLSAFFPLFPILAKLLVLLGVNPLVGLLIISNLALLIGLAVFLEEVRLILGENYQFSAGIILLNFPGAFFFFSPFPQSLALLIILLCWKFARQQRWFLAALTGLLSGLSHPTVLPLMLLMLLIVLEWLRNGINRLRWTTLFIPIMPATGMIAFLAWRENQGFLPYVQYQQEIWGMSVFNPVAGVHQLFQSIETGNAVSVIKFLILLLIIISLYWLLKNRYYWLGLYQAAVVIYLISFTMPLHPFGSFIRYNLISFPLFFALTAMLTKKPWLFSITTISLGIINFLMCVLYISWFFVA